MPETPIGLSASERAKLALDEKRKIWDIRTDWNPLNGGRLPIEVEKEINQRYGLDSLSPRDIIDLVVHYYLIPGTSRQGR